MIPHLSSPLPSISLYIPLDFLNLDQKMIQQNRSSSSFLPFSRHRTPLVSNRSSSCHRTLSGRGWWRRETLRGVGGSHGGSAGGGETGGVRDPGWKMMENHGKPGENMGKKGEQGENWWDLRWTSSFFFWVLRDVLVDFDGFKILDFFKTKLVNKKWWYNL